MNKTCKASSKLKRPSIFVPFRSLLQPCSTLRIAIARVMIRNPTFLILDEPTSALDVSVQAVVLQLLDRLKYELGMSYIFVSHDLNVVRLLCERVVVMNRGKIVEQGAADDVLRSPSDPYTRALVDAIPQFEPQMIK